MLERLRDDFKALPDCCRSRCRASASRAAREPPSPSPSRLLVGAGVAEPDQLGLF